MHALSERLFLSAVREHAHVKTVLIERGSIEQSCCFFALYWSNTHTCTCQNAGICKHPHKHSNLGRKAALSEFCQIMLIFESTKT